MHDKARRFLPDNAVHWIRENAVKRVVRYNPYILLRLYTFVLNMYAKFYLFF